MEFGGDGDDLSGHNSKQANVLVIGNGGREHAIGWKLKQNPNLRLFFAPGNGGTAEIGDNIDIKVDEITKLADFAESYKMDLTVVGPELPLTLGVVDEFNKRGLKIFGPNKSAARLEGSKTFAKDFMKKYNIPTAEYDSVSSIEDGKEVLLNRRFPLVLKADGLAAGKGVIVCNSISEATTVLEDIMSDGVFGDAGNKVVIEEFLEGKEVSLLCFADSNTIVPMETASDYKRALDKDLGANTGGMGCISPSPYYTPRLGDEIAEKTLDGLKAEGIDYQGVLYIGLILTSDGPKVLEYNARFGDPETQVLLPRLDADLYEIALAVVEKRLAECEMKWKNNKAVAVVMASAGYPGKYETGHEIEAKQTKSTVFHAGTKLEGGRFFTDGGRVLAVTATGDTFDSARKAVYRDIKNITFSGAQYRSDIGQTAAQRGATAVRF
ncbi:MAG: phosphoribosylamine--glycine ligase [Oscillospiraceae bacterium]|nr:phosphoribosylamine--glycine ligase [Oscillospiraceae bacterium]